ncbi:hypothetical protein EZV62_009577 [Acer yangbiense]|uniref:Uncharacterized protein n=1 Tax=Acer yangbiense TaxID=1000413 RepID=A0A5C7HZF0_9ROSI|nr:hypothetical protein EZV62_009577 [Acer yangbiense]
MEEQRIGGHRVRRTITVTRRPKNHKITIELQGNSDRFNIYQLFLLYMIQVEFNFHWFVLSMTMRNDTRAYILLLCLIGRCREQKLFSHMPYHAVFGFLIPLLVAVLQLNQGTNNYSFQTHPANLWVFLLSTSVYCFAFVADIKSNPSYAQRYSLVAVISGSLSSVSLISLFLPDLPGRLIFIPWAFASIVVSRSYIINLCCWLYQMIMKTFFQVVGIWNRFKASGLMPRLPV